MNNFNPYKNFFLRMKRYFKEDMNNLYNKLSKNKFLKLISQHKIISGLILILAIFLYVFVINLNDYLIKVENHNNRLNGPNVNNVLLSEDIHIVYTGEVNYGKIEGIGKLILQTDSFEITFNGTFENIDNKIDGYIQIGEFINGTITVNALNSNITYVWNGDFKSGNLIKGYLEVNDLSKNEIITYEGFFKNGKLEGSGKKTLQKNNKIKTIIGWFDNGVLKEE